MGIRSLHIQYGTVQYMYEFLLSRRCEYEMTFETPSACEDPKNIFGGGTMHPPLHDEL